MESPPEKTAHRSGGGFQAEGLANAPLTTPDPAPTTRSESTPALNSSTNKDSSHTPRKPPRGDLLRKRYNEAARSKPSHFAEDVQIQPWLRFYRWEDNRFVRSDSAGAQYWGVLDENTGATVIFLSLIYFLNKRSSLGAGEDRSGARALLSPVFDIAIENGAYITIDEPAIAQMESGNDTLVFHKSGRLRW